MLWETKWTGGRWPESVITPHEQEDDQGKLLVNSMNGFRTRRRVSRRVVAAVFVMCSLVVLVVCSIALNTCCREVSVAGPLPLFYLSSDGAENEGLNADVRLKTGLRKTLVHHTENKGQIHRSRSPFAADQPGEVTQTGRGGPPTGKHGFKQMSGGLSYDDSFYLVEEEGGEREGAHSVSDKEFKEHGQSYPPASGQERDGDALIRTSKSASKKLPQSIIMGVKKGGTRALLEFIRLHPDVRAPGPETHFFDRHYHRGLDWYRDQMPATIDGQLTMEKTPSYFVTKEVPRRIYNMSKDVKLILVVRDPVTRAISDYTQTISKKPWIKTFEQMAFLDNVTRVVDTSWGAVRIGVYAKHLERWLRYFPLSQMHFVSGERLITDPAGEMAKVQDFLGLKRIISAKHFYINETKGFPCLKKPEGSGNPHCLGKTKGRQHPVIDKNVLQRLRDFFRPFNAKFYQMVHQNFGWP